MTPSHRHPRRYVRRALLAGAAGAVSLSGCGSMFYAAQLDDARRVGVHLGAGFGRGAVRLNYGIDVSYEHVVLRLEGHGTAFFRMALAGRIDTLGAFAEAGLAYQTGQQRAAIGQSVGVHLGGFVGLPVGGMLAQGSIPFAGDTANWSAGIAAQIHPIGFSAVFQQQSEGVPGRPWRTPTGARLTPPLHTDDVALTTRDPGLAREHAALTRHWRDAGRDEHASICSFLRLADELAAQQAPSALVARARRAAADEAVHAAGCFDQAARFSGVHVRAATLPRVARWQRPNPHGVATLAREAWHDGCLGEGTAARWAERSAARSRDEATTRLQRRIAEDEARHAELAWDILAWAALANRDVRDALAEARSSTSAPLSAAEPANDLDARWLADHGELPPATRDALREAVHTNARRRLGRVLDRATSSA